MQGENNFWGSEKQIVGLGSWDWLAFWGTDALFNSPGYHDELKVKELGHLSLCVN